MHTVDSSNNVVFWDPKGEKHLIAEFQNRITAFEFASFLNGGGNMPALNEKQKFQLFSQFKVTATGED